MDHGILPDHAASPPPPAGLRPDIRKALAPLEAALCEIALPGEGPSRGRFSLAYSGGMDSRFLAHAAHLLGFIPHLLMAVGPQLPPEERAFGEGWAQRNRLPLRQVEVDPLHLPLVARNDRRRCYECKRALFRRLLETLRQEAPHAPLPLCDGTNASDALAYRPGTQAVQELGVLSPLALAELSKPDIYRLAALTGMERPDQKPRPCLLTRLPYGMKPKREVLEALAAGEQAVRRALARAGLPEADFRLRLVPNEKKTCTLALHLLKSEAEKLPQALADELAALLAEAAPALPHPARLVPQDTLSGFFDRLADNT